MNEYSNSCQHDIWILKFKIFLKRSIFYDIFVWVYCKHWLNSCHVLNIYQKTTLIIFDKSLFGQQLPHSKLLVVHELIQRKPHYTNHIWLSRITRLILYVWNSNVKFSYYKLVLHIPYPSFINFVYYFNRECSKIIMNRDIKFLTYY